jgi:hypothetical protein
MCFLCKYNKISYNIAKNHNMKENIYLKLSRENIYKTHIYSIYETKKKMLHM